MDRHNSVPREDADVTGTGTDVWWDAIDTNVQPTFDRYWEDERENLTPALERAGFTSVQRWRTGDGDSFGPLTRCVRAISPTGEAVTVVYG